MLGNESYSSMNRLVPGSSPGRTAKNVIAVVSWCWKHLKNLRSVAQPGRALALGARCREFESRYSDPPVGVSGNPQSYLLALTESKTPGIFHWCRNGSVGSNTTRGAIHKYECRGFVTRGVSFNNVTLL